MQKKISPKNQLLKELTNEEERNVMTCVLDCLKPEYQDDLCYSLLAFMKYGIHREFESPFMQIVFDILISAGQNENSND